MTVNREDYGDFNTSADFRLMTERISVGNKY